MVQKNIEKEAHRVVEGGEADKESRQTQNPGDNRTPDKPIGHVEYADNEGGGDQKEQSGSTRTSTLEDNRAQRSQAEGPAAYAPHEDQVIRSKSGDPARKKTGEF
jgi:hypothetical protein